MVINAERNDLINRNSLTGKGGAASALFLLTGIPLTEKEFFG
jgi:hypothetical protein